MSVHINLTAIAVFCPESLETAGVDPQHEVIGKDRIIVLENGCDFPLVLSPQVKMDRPGIRFIEEAVPFCFPW